MRERLSVAAGLLDASNEVNSNAWLAAGQQLSFASLRLASAAYCLAEWPEPGDDSADPSKPWKRGRLNPDR
jgi:hypothetical protein